MRPTPLNVFWSVPMVWVPYFSTENVLGTLVTQPPDSPSVTVASVAFSLN